ncbi:MAG: CaiB/BaiF CoA transferase family protein [Steroidobacteraceae bacterium]|jgi:crotonobetainyl-CoA:carnitine CoA-transferase CaiB-like acyl-CoA transferase|nr:CoA transferase [Gammaproteobacteria bacterium]NBR16468.1 CoA transferase [Gammaproteobacteria bacterium]NDE86201.1 CoA transferase [Gammaproteobacteria bacterium]
MSGPLQGIKVVEMTSVVLGPWACQMLADMGAEVIKIEQPRGDSNRSLGAANNPGMAALYLTCNRNKRSIVLDLRVAGARDAVLALVKNADVFIHNNRPQVMTKLGLDYADLRKVNPRIIYCGAYGYSKKGPYGKLGALDDSIQAASGIAMLNEMVLGEPRYLPTIVADKTTAITVVYGVLAALFHRERTGEGQELEVPMFETMVNWVMAEHLWGMTFDPPKGKPGYTRLMSKDRKPYKTKDGYIAVLPYLDAHWVKFCEITGYPQFIDDERFRTLADRVRNIDATNQTTAMIMATRTTTEWLGVLAPSGIPHIVVNTLEDLATDPHLEATGFWQSFDHPTEGKLRLPSFPVNFGSTPASIRRAAPRLGEHTVEVLREAGVDTATIDSLTASGAAMTAEQAAKSVGQGGD